MYNLERKRSGQVNAPMDTLVDVSFRVSRFFLVPVGCCSLSSCSRQQVLHVVLL
jgi:hypothetical protein